MLHTTKRNAMLTRTLDLAATLGAVETTELPGGGEAWVPWVLLIAGGGWGYLPHPRMELSTGVPSE